MGVKSTYEIDRETVERFYVSFKQDLMKRKLLSEAVAMSNKELENILEEMNDELHDDEGFQNYNII